MINVTKPYLPPIQEFNEYIADIWESGWLTNEGKYHKQLEKELANYLNVPYVSLFANGTLALITALQALRIQGEVITTPYSFVATTHALWWNRNKPVFVDIEPNFCTLDPVKIEAAITPDTTAILPVHVYGYPCQVERIQEIADKYGLQVIYDAAHAMGVWYKGKSLASYGDLSILSFHATKLFHTFEGGAIVCHNKETKQRVDYLKNFGFEDETTVVMPGINAKMNEVQAAMGLINLKHINTILDKRKKIADRYKVELSQKLIKPKDDGEKNVTNNYAYYPIFVDKIEGSESVRDKLYEYLKRYEINTRRYFYPLINEFSAYRKHNELGRGAFKVARQKSQAVLCLPIYPDLKIEEQDKIIKLINEFVQ
jgi:dTDP-4-amino-4,6-dideoxygalactose transaminase